MANKRVVITRPSGPYAGGERLNQRLKGLGFETFELPLLECRALVLSDQARSTALESLRSAQGAWLAFLSPTAVWIWRDLIRDDQELRDLSAKARFAAQGSGTAEALVECFGRSAEFTPSVFLAEEFAREFAQRLARGAEVLVPQSADGRDLLAPTLLSLGVRAASVTTYRLERAELSTESLDKFRSFVDIDTVVIFMSPSAVKAAVAQIKEYLVGVRLLSVGPITSQVIVKAGLEVWREAREHSEQGVIEALGMQCAS